MNNQFAALALFCSDVREEKTNSVTLVGVHLDNIDVESFPAMLATLHIYVRRPIDPASNEEPPAIFLSLPDGQETPMSEIDAEVLRTTREKARSGGSPVTFIVSRASFTPFPIEKPGRIDVVVRGEGVERVCGSLTFRHRAPKATNLPATVLPRPAKRSRGAGKKKAS